MCLGDWHGPKRSRAGPRARSGRGGRLLLALSLFFTVGQEGSAAENPPVVPAQERAGTAMDLTLDQLLEVNVDTVYGASKYEQRITQAPASVTVVTEDEIKKQ